MDRIPTGITGLDELLKGGLPENIAIGLFGDVGSGKEALCNQTVWNMLNEDCYILYYAVDKSSNDIRDDMSQNGWDIEPFEKDDRLHFVDVFSRGMGIIQEKMYDTGELDTPDAISFNFKEMISEGRNYTLKMMLRRRRLIVVYYSMSPLFTLSDTREVLRFLQYGKYATRISKAIGIAVLHSGVHGEDIENAFRSLADGVIELRRKEKNGHTARFLRINKMPRTAFTENFYPLDVTSKGVEVYPFSVSSF